MTDWDDIRYFLHAVRAGNYTTAAQRLQVNRTTIGRRLAHLEESLGVPLYEQTEEGYRPTPAGQLVLDCGQAMEQSILDLADRLARLRSGGGSVVRVIASAGIASEFLPELLAFRALHPDVTVELVSGRDALRTLLQRKADLGLCLVDSRPGYLLGQRIGQLTPALYGSAAYAARRGASADHDWVCWGNEMAALPDRWVRLNLRPGLGAVLEVNSWAELRQAVADGFGVAWLWTQFADTVPGLVRFAEPLADAGIGFWLLYRSDVPLDPGAKALSDYLGRTLPRRWTREGAATNER